MKRIIFLLAAVFVLAGCATYKFQEGVKPPYDKGYVVSYWGDILPEYTVGKNNTVPADLSLAKERFERRRLTVEKYYKDMGYIESRLKEVFWDPPVTMLHILLGIFKLPFIAYSDYRYENDPKYRAEIIKAEEDEYEKEKARIKTLKEGLTNYIQEDLSREVSEPAVTSQTQAIEKKTILQQEEKMREAAAVEKQPVMKPEETNKAEKEEAAPAQETKIPQVTQVENKIEEVKLKEEVRVNMPVAVIIARPTKGFSPLKVNFYGTKSHSSNGKIVSYEWDFGDGDTSRGPKVVNTFWSTTYGGRIFIVTLTVKDAKGMTATTTREIEVTNK